MPSHFLLSIFRSSGTRHGKTYQYAQLVESVRREHDGMPAHRVIANLGRIADPVHPLRQRRHEVCVQGDPVAAYALRWFASRRSCDERAIRQSKPCERGVFVQWDSIGSHNHYYTATSLDGFLATEDDSLDWLFALGDTNDTSYPAFIVEVGSLANGTFHST